MRYIDLFAGTGAFSHVLDKKGWECVFANDMELSSQQIYTENHGSDTFQLGDLHEIETDSIPSHDLLCAGFPCQPFSIAGRQEGFQDPRSNVFWKILDILAHHQPLMILLENVRNLQSHDHGKTFEIILSCLKEKGYHLHYQVLDTAQVSRIPQHRERIYIVGFLEKEAYERFSFDFDAEEDALPLTHFLDDYVPEKYYYTKKLAVYPAIVDAVVKPIRQSNTLYQYRRYYVRENKKNQCPTLTANMGTGGHNVPLLLDTKGIRKLTPRECFRLQGFPDEYHLPKVSDSLLYKLAGNAVSVPVVEKIVDRLMG